MFPMARNFTLAGTTGQVILAPCDGCMLGYGTIFIVFFSKVSFFFF